MVGVELTEKKRLECLEINIQGTKFILDAAVKQKVKKVFFHRRQKFMEIKR